MWGAYRATCGEREIMAPRDKSGNDDAWVENAQNDATRGRPGALDRKPLE